MAPCPWSNLEPATSRFCEDALCGIVREPANTWSNIGFVVAGFMIAWRARGEAQSRLIRRFGLVCVFLGVGSAIFHATGTWVGGMLDSAGMQAAAAFMLAANLRRLRPAAPLRVAERVAERNDARAFWLLAAGGVAAMSLFEELSRALYALEMTLAGVLELVVVRRAHLQRAHRWLALSWATFLPAYAFWWLDLHRIACNPSAHVMNGHAAWHLLMAASLFFVHRFHAELAGAGPGFRSPRRGTRDGSASLARARYRA